MRIATDNIKPQPMRKPRNLSQVHLGCEGFRDVNLLGLRMARIQAAAKKWKS
jgi:hypothetical protein